MTTATLSARPGLELPNELPINLPIDTEHGQWRSVAGQSHADFVARVARRSVRGRLPVDGEASLEGAVAGTLDRFSTRLSASTSTLVTGSRVLDQILKGPGFLEVDAHPEITFSSDELTRVPTGWRAIGWLRLKSVEYELACELTLAPVPRRPGQPPRLCAVSHWALDSTWITGSRIPGLSRRVAMTSSVVLEPAV